MRKKNILITGRPRCGKTTLIKHFAQILGARGGGFYTEEVHGEGVRGRSGCRLVTLEGIEGMLAEVDFDSPFRLGRYGVNLEVMERLAVPAIEHALRDKNKKWILIDEIGKMEEGSDSFKKCVLAALDSTKSILAAIRLNDSDFTREIKKRKDVILIKLTVPDRELIYQNISSLMNLSK
jgi:nucleoside-triphosphatase THEP1